MYDINEINMAISIIKNVCIQHPNCGKDHCPLHDGADCSLNTGEPDCWEEIKEDD